MVVAAALTGNCVFRFGSPENYHAPERRAKKRLNPAIALNGAVL
jgi:hypothetical protein